MIKLITHNDLDGIGCYVVAKYFIEEEVDVSYCSYKNVNDVVLETIENIEKYRIYKAARNSSLFFCVNLAHIYTH